MCRTGQLASTALFAVLLCGALMGQVLEISTRDYAVLSDFLRAQLDGENFFRTGPKSSVIALLTDANLKHLAIREGDWMKSRLELASDTLADSEQCADRKMAITKRFDLPVEYQIALPEATSDIKDMDVKGIRALYAHYPGTNGVIQFSCVGVNASHTQALFFVQRNGRAPNGRWILMQKNASGKWILKSELIKWMV